MPMYAEYLQTIAERLEPYFDLFWGERVAGKSMDLVAKFKMRNEKYFFSKRITLYAYENHETVLVQRTGKLHRQRSGTFVPSSRKPLRS